MAEAILTTRGVAKSFGAYQVLADVGFRVEDGEIVGLLGPNGSGKSTLLNIVSGFQEPDAGTVELLGASIAGQPAHRIARRGLARTFQLPAMPERMTVREMVRAGSRAGSGFLDIFRADSRHDDDVDELICEFMLEAVADHPASLLSGGQKKLLSIAVALRSRPRLLCLDEPTAGVHPQLRRRMVALLKSLNARGVSILVVEHDMHFIGELCGRCIVLDRGEIVADCPPAKLVENERVVEAYLGRSGEMQKARAIA